MDTKKLKLEIIDAAEKAVKELIKVAREDIIVDGSDVGELPPDIAADKLKTAAAAKKLALFDAFEIIERIEQERERIKSYENPDAENLSGGFAERKSR